MSSRHFSLAEAEALIPELEKVFASVLEIAERARAKAALVRELEERGGGRVAELALEKGQLQFLANGLADWLRRVEELGAIPKGIEPALVDFPHRLEGREVYLCWRLGEKAITHYHGVDEGFSGRRPLPGRRAS